MIKADPRVVRLMPLDTELRFLEECRNREYSQLVYGDTPNSVHRTFVIKQVLNPSNEVSKNPRRHGAK